MTDDRKTYQSGMGSDGCWCVTGPGNGFGYTAGTLWPELRFETEAQAKAAARLCNEAYRQGREAVRHELRQLLGAAQAERR